MYSAARTADYKHTVTSSLYGGIKLLPQKRMRVCHSLAKYEEKHEKLKYFTLTPIRYHGKKLSDTKIENKMSQSKE